MKNYYQKLTDLFSVLDKISYDNESKKNCETDLNILKDYEISDKNPLFPIKKVIKNRFSAEIEAKKTEITNRLETLFWEEINVASNEDYGVGKLNFERKKIFTTYRNQIENATILTEIKALIRLLIKAEKIISETNHLDKMTLANKLKEEYQNGQGDKKTAYTIVNQVDNSWVDGNITELEKFKQKDPAILLAECRVQLKAKYNNSAMAEAVFGNNILDTMSALQEAEKLLIKVQEAQSKEDADTSLLTFLQNYLIAKNENEFNIRNKSWQAVNGYNKQAEAAIKHLQKNDQSREKIVKIIQEAKNENELEIAYNQVKNSELYKKGDKSKIIIDNLNTRKKILFQIEQENDISDENKNFFKTILAKLIPDTIKNDQDERELTKLENQLKIFQNTPPS
ncbi:MAG: hypothetical protein I3273_07145 [Candidatus Moeniiplasma glomeromycotorum]|nr:hypothetical protein [Candidatus Moeniiplasma glomeromycotorum]MCE8168384.1 hypothetical protein [Candidatus Moeniiplasma glomeromycotorum]MCE8169862.1 hypothetical protein [Candidatus Moeniiplasma glomeromycotorum]